METKDIDHLLVDENGIEIDIPADDLLRIKDDVRNLHSCVEVQYLYNKLKRMGPWGVDDFTIELILDNDALHSALVVAYGRIFTTGLRKIARKKVPKELRQIHDELITLHHKRYAHSDKHDSMETQLDLEFDGETILLNTKLSMITVLGAPEHWEPLFDWLNEYLHDQLKSQLGRLSEITGYKWEQMSGPIPSWVADAD